MRNSYLMFATALLAGLFACSSCHHVVVDPVPTPAQEVPEVQNSEYFAAPRDPIDLLRGDISVDFPGGCLTDWTPIVEDLPGGWRAYNCNEFFGTGQAFPVLLGVAAKDDIIFDVTVIEIWDTQEETMQAAMGYNIQFSMVCDLVGSDDYNIIYQCSSFPGVDEFFVTLGASSFASSFGVTMEFWYDIDLVDQFFDTFDF